MSRKRSSGLVDSTYPQRVAETQRLILSSAGSCDVDKLMLSLELHFGGGIPPSRAKGKGKGHATHVTDAVAGQEPTDEIAITKPAVEEPGEDWVDMVTWPEWQKPCP
eukprot:3180407-Amphidinium_carterae.1